MNHYANSPGNVYRDTSNGSVVDGRDGITFSMWESEKAMFEAAYKAGVHRDQMDDHSSDAMFDRSSFSRFQVLETKGNWGRSAAPV